MTITSNADSFVLNPRALKDAGFKGNKCMVSNLNKKEISWTVARVLSLVFKVSRIGLGKK